MPARVPDGAATSRAERWFAIDHSHRLWLGATPRFFLANPPYARDRWFVITGDVTFRF
jgi:hypothetical protein